MNCNENRYLLLQINDALFPIGGYSHSYGLETYIQKNIIQNEEDARNYIEKKIRYNLASAELLASRLCYEAAQKEDMRKLLELEETYFVSLVPREIREAARKLGSRFVKTVSRLKVSYRNSAFEKYQSAEESTHMHACAYGCFCAAAGIKENEMLENYLYSQTSAMVTNCVKSIPLSQTSGQKILTDTFEIFDEVIEQVMEWDEEMLCVGAPGFDIRSMEHERLYSRIYMS
ncbi:MAG: urease accessory protein UreF [Ruminococcus sp.]|jgi:urease accessory protein